MTTDTAAEIEEAALPEVSRLARRAVREAAATMDRDAVAYHVDLYYEMQEFRKAAANRLRSATGPTLVQDWTLHQFETTEAVVRTLLDEYTDTTVVGRWARSIVGIGPVLTAGLLAHIDIERAPTVGHIWRFAGLDPTVRWTKGQKRPWNARLKTLCWKIGDSFVKVHNHDEDVYGHIYAERKVLELERDAAGLFAEQAAASLADRNIRDAALRATYESGHLPLGRLDARARRYAVKLFLSHLHHVMFEDRFGTPPPMPYVLTRPEHTHYLAPPNWPMVVE